MSEPPARRPSFLRRWLRRALKGAILSILLLVVIRLVLPFVLPGALDTVAGRFGLHAEYDALKLRLHDGSFELWGLRVGPAGTEEVPAPPFLVVDYAAVDVELRSILSGKPRVRRVAADGVRLDLDRKESGEWVLLETLAPLLAGSGEPMRAAEEEDASTDVSLSLPFEVRSLRVNDAALDLDDRALDPPLALTLTGDLAVTDLGPSERPARTEAHGRGAQPFDAAVFEGSAELAGESLGSTFRFELDGFHPKLLAGYLQPLGVEPVAEVLELHGAGRTELGYAGESHDAITAELRLERLAFEVDLEEHFAVDTVTIGIDRLSSEGCVVSQVDVAGVRGRARRTAAGRLRVAGLELTSPTPAATSTAPTAEPEPAPEVAASEPEAAEPDAAAPPAFPFPIEVSKLAVIGCALRFDDDAMQPPVALELAIDDSELRHLVIDPARPDEIGSLGAEVRLPGIVEVAGVVVRMGVDWPKIDASCLVVAEGIAPERLEPYLDALGIESTWKSGKLTARILGEVELTASGLRAEGSVTDVELGDEGEAEPYLEIERLAASGIELAPAEERYVLGDLELVGARVVARRDAERTFHALGLRFGTASGGEIAAAVEQDAEGSREETAPSASTSAKPAALPHLEITSVRWSDTRLELVDDTPEQQHSFVLDDLEATLSRLIVGGADDGTERPPARFDLRGSLGELASRFEVDGELRSRPGEVDVSGALHLEADGLHLVALDTYLEPLAIEPTLDAGRLALDVELGLRRAGNGSLEGHLALRDVLLLEGEEHLASLGRLEIRELSADTRRIRIGAIEIDEPFLAVELDGEGALRSSGLRVLPRTPPEGGPKRLPHLGELIDLHVIEDSIRAIALGEGPVLELDSLLLDGARLGWIDARVAPAVRTELGLSSQVNDLRLGGDEGWATFDSRLSVEGAVGELRASGRLLAAPRHLAAETTIEGRGLRIGPLASYRPPGLESTLEDGRLRLRVEGELVEKEDGSLVASSTTRDFDYREAGSDAPLLAFERMAASAPRIDAKNHVLELGAVECVGLRAALHRASATRWEAGGAVVDVEALSRATATGEGEPEEGATMSPPAAAPGEPSIAELRTARHPRLSVESLDLELAALHFTDATRPDAAPIDLALSLRGESGPLVLLDEHPEELAPLVLHLGGALQPVIGELDVTATLEPYAADPHVRVKGRAAGLSGTGLVALVPELAEKLDGSGLENGEATGSLDVTLHARRRGPLQFDWDSGFGLEAELGECVLRVTPDGEPALALGGLLADVRRVRPKTGAVQVAELELVEPRGAVTRVDEGIRVAGLLLKVAPAVEVDREEPPAAGSTAEPTVPVTAPAEVAATSEPLPDLRIDRFYVTGLDLSIADETVEPPLVLPLADLDLSVTGLSSRAIEEGRPVRLQTLVTAGDVRLPARDSAGDLVPLAEGQESEWPLGDYEVESRPAFDELSLSGELVLKPELRGRAKLDLWGLELLGAAGEARNYGIDIHDGVLDSTIEMRLDAKRGLGVDAVSTFTWLSLSEGDEGPIRSTLALPAPLDTVIFMTRNSSGENRIPVSFDVPVTGLDLVDITAAATSTVAQVLATSIAQSPFRLIGGVLDVGGLLSSDPVPRAKETVEFELRPGEVRLAAGEIEKLAPLVAMLERDPSLVLVVQHRLGRADHAKAEALANPDPATCRELVERLRREKAGLQERRDLQAAKVRATYALWDLDRAEALAAELRDLDARLGRHEQALDELCAFLRPGAERRRDRRTKLACTSLARERLSAARAALLALEVPGIGERVQVRRPRYAVPTEEDPLRGSIVITPVRR